MASGDTLLIFTPYHATPTTANYATFDTINQHPVLDFDGATNESAVFSAVMPRNYAGGGLTVYLHWACDSTAGDLDWDIAFERIGDGIFDIDADGFAAVQSANNLPVPGVSHVVNVNFITFTDGAQIDTTGVGDGFRMKVTRDAASDTNTDDANLLFVEIKET